MNMARQCWDEARHVQIYEKLIEHVGGEVGEFPESTFLFETSCARRSGAARDRREPLPRRAWPATPSDR